METAKSHASRDTLEDGLDDILASPKDSGRLETIILRPAENERRAVDSARLTPERGIEGDRWATDHWQKLPNGWPDPVSQISLMNVRILRLIAGSEDAIHLAGDNLIVDLDLSEKNLPAGSHLQIGKDVVLELTTQPHTGCKKFSSRYGQAALQFVNGPQGKPLNFRGRYARVVQSGIILVGDSAVKRLSRTPSTGA